MTQHFKRRTVPELSIPAAIPTGLNREIGSPRRVGARSRVLERAIAHVEKASLPS